VKIEPPAAMNPYAAVNLHAAVAYQQVYGSLASWSCDAIIPLVAHGGSTVSEHVALEPIQRHCPQPPAGCWDVKRIW
jgi:hypothetical protein